MDALGQDEGVVRRRADDQRLNDAHVLRELEYEGRHRAHHDADDEAAEDHGEEAEDGSRRQCNEANDATYLSLSICCCEVKIVLLKV